jgi:hypothetical protein
MQDTNAHLALYNDSPETQKGITVLKPYVPKPGKPDPQRGPTRVQWLLALILVVVLIRVAIVVSGG